MGTPFDDNEDDDIAPPGLAQLQRILGTQAFFIDERGHYIFQHIITSHQFDEINSFHKQLTAFIGELKRHIGNGIRIIETKDFIEEQLGLPGGTVIQINNRPFVPLDALDETAQRRLKEQTESCLPKGMADCLKQINLKAPAPDFRKEIDNEPPPGQSRNF